MRFFTTIALFGAVSAIKLNQQKQPKSTHGTEGEGEGEISLHEIMDAAWGAWDQDQNGLDREEARKVIMGVADLAGKTDQERKEISEGLDKFFDAQPEGWRGGPEDLWEGIKDVAGIDGEVPIYAAPAYLFKALDKNGDGGVDLEEAMYGVKALHLPFSEEDVKKFGAQLDEDGNGKVDGDELADFLESEFSDMESHCSEHGCEHEDMMSDAESFWSDRESEWSEREGEGEPELDMEDVMNGLWRGLDRDGSGKLDKKEVKRFFKGILKAVGKEGEESKEALKKFNEWFNSQGVEEIDI